MVAGALRVLGRLDLLRKRNGVWIDLHQIELVTKQHPGIEDVAAFLGEPENSNQPLTLCLETKSDLSQFLKMIGSDGQLVESNQNSEESLRVWMLQKLPLAAQPTHIQLWKEFPRTSAGKIKRTALKSLDSFQYDASMDCKTSIVNAKLDPHDKDSTGKFSEGAVLSAFCNALNAVGLEPTSDFFACGGNSLTANAAASRLGISPLLIWGYRCARRLSQALAGGHTSFDLKSEPHESNKEKIYLLQLEVVKPTGLGTHISGVNLCVKRSSLALNNVDGYDHFQHIINCSKRRKLTAGSSQCRTNMVKACGLQYPAAPGSALEHFLLEGPDSPRALRRKKDPHLATEYIAAWESGEFESCLISCHPMHCVKITHSGAVLWECTDQNKFMHHREDGFKRIWSRKLSLCVDAPPAILLFLDKHSDCKRKGLVFACCHGGEVACFQFHDGTQVWSEILERRANAGFAITKSLKYVVVGSENEAIFLNLANGQIYKKIDAGNTINGLPMMDPWKGYIWIASHGNQVLVVDSSGEYKYRCSLTIRNSSQVLAYLFASCLMIQFFKVPRTRSYIMLNCL